MAPTTATRASTAHSKPSKASPDGIKKKFACAHPGCGKSFSRSEHLHRHALNHKDGTNTCMRCSAHFRRRDLLDRHMARHKEKDDEAGGPGLGVLATRKRLWRDVDGNIVNARRPTYVAHADGAKRRQLSRADHDARRARPSTTHHPRPPPSPTAAPPMSRAGSARSTIVVDTPADDEHDGHASRKPIELKIDTHWLDLGTTTTTTTTAAAALLPSPPTSHATPSEPHSPPLTPAPADDLSDLDALYEDSDDAWPALDAALPPLAHAGLPHHHPSISSQGSSASASSLYPETPSWDAGPQAFQAFMGSVGGVGGELGYGGAQEAEEEEEDLFQPEPELDAGLYDWQGHGWAWHNASVGVGVSVSRVREERFEPLRVQPPGQKRRATAAAAAATTTTWWMGTRQEGQPFRKFYGLGAC